MLWRPRGCRCVRAAVENSELMLSYNDGLRRPSAMRLSSFRFPIAPIDPQLPGERSRFDDEVVDHFGLGL